MVPNCFVESRRPRVKQAINNWTVALPLGNGG